LFVLGRGNRSV